MLPQQDYAGNHQPYTQPVTSIDVFFKQISGYQCDQDKIETEHRVGDPDFKPLQYQQPYQQTETQAQQR